MVMDRNVKLKYDLFGGESETCVTRDWAWDWTWRIVDAKDMNGAGGCEIAVAMGAITDGRGGMMVGIASMLRL